MAREFTKSMFVMLLSIMVGVVIITYFVADIVNRSKIETLTITHIEEIQDLNSRNENFTNYYLQGAILMDSAREIREVGNYHFDFALFWFNNALVNISASLIQKCIDNCTTAMDKYISSYGKFGESKPYFENALGYTDNNRYKEALGYYINFSKAGQYITLLRYNASDYLRRAAENLSLGNIDNVSSLMENFTLTEELYLEGLQDYNDLKNQIDNYLFFDPIREPH
ncbi:MAG: hypothetical protein QHH19_03020 [Candidatus Thermoplasmatota archaeon]|jgi:hypothetical protein|nr:hypothetical protein [Candidatus Thermoplasmatota archaeon]